MINKTWRIEETEFDKTAIEQNGSRFLVANGYMGYRGTLEEFRAPQLTALNLAGLFDRNGDSWRESVNAPNPLYTYTRIGKEKLDVLCLPIRTHRQQLDFFTRSTAVRRCLFCMTARRSACAPSALQVWPMNIFWLCAMR